MSDTISMEADRSLEQWIDCVRTNAAALRDNRAPPELLFEIGMAYFYGFSPAVARLSAEPGLADVLVSDDLVEAATIGLCGTVHRQDVPEITEIFRLHVDAKMHPLGPPFLAGMAEMDRANRTRWRT